MTFKQFMRTYGFRKGPPKTPFQIVWSIICVLLFVGLITIGQVWHSRVAAYVSFVLFGLFFVAFLLSQIGVVDGPNSPMDEER